MRRMLFLTLGLLAGVTALAFVQPAEAGPFKHRSGGCGECSGGGGGGGGGFHLFHRGGGTASTYQGCSGGYGGCMGQVAGCNSCGGQQLQAVPCSNCPGGVRYQAAWSGEYGGTAVAGVNNPVQQFAVPDGQGGYRIVNASGFHNGLPIVNPNDQAGQPATAQQLPVPKAMPNK